MAISLVINTMEKHSQEYIVKQSFTLVGSDMEMELMESRRGLRFIERTTIQTI